MPGLIKWTLLLFLLVTVGLESSDGRRYVKPKPRDESAFPAFQAPPVPDQCTAEFKQLNKIMNSLEFKDKETFDFLLLMSFHTSHPSFDRTCSVLETFLQCLPNTTTPDVWNKVYGAAQFWCNKKEELSKARDCMANINDQDQCTDQVVQSMRWTREFILAQTKPNFLETCKADMASRKCLEPLWRKSSGCGNSQTNLMFELYAKQIDSVTAYFSVHPLPVPCFDMLQYMKKSREQNEVVETGVLGLEFSTNQIMLIALGCCGVALTVIVTIITLVCKCCIKNKDEDDETSCGASSQNEDEEEQSEHENEKNVYDCPV